MTANAKISKKIVSFSVVNPDDAKKEEQKPVPQIAFESLSRPERLRGTTYKLKTPVSDAAMYITINDVIIDEGTATEHARPFEIFINSKNMEHYQWMVALTRVISAVFRKGGDVVFLVEELLSVFDPKGGYFKKGGKYVPSLVAEIGFVIEEHLKSIGMIKDQELDEHQKKLIADKRAALEAAAPKNEEASSDFPPHAQLCNKCHTKAMILQDGCQTCLSCGESKCG